MTRTSTDTAAHRDAGPGRTDLERQVAASERASGRDTGGDVRAVARHDIGTVSAAGTFLGDYLDEDPALAAAAQARGHDETGGAADRWRRADAGARP